MTETQEKLRALLEGLSDEELRRPEGEGRRWSVLDVLAHLGDLEMVYAVRMRDLLAGSGERPLQLLAQDEWIQRVHRRDETVEELLEQFAFHRRMNLALFARLSDEELDRTGVHPQYGTLSLRDIKERLERHDTKHLGQIERIKATLGL